MFRWFFFRSDYYIYNIVRSNQSETKESLTSFRVGRSRTFFRAGWWQYPVTFVTQGFRWLKNSCAGGHPSLLRYNYLFPTSHHTSEIMLLTSWKISGDRWIFLVQSLMIDESEFFIDQNLIFQKCKLTIKQSALGLSTLHLLITLIHKKIISFFRGRISNFRSVYNNDVDSIQSNMLQQIS